MEDHTYRFTPGAAGSFRALICWWPHINEIRAGAYHFGGRCDHPYFSFRSFTCTAAIKLSVRFRTAANPLGRFDRSVREGGSVRCGRSGLLFVGVRNRVVIIPPGDTLSQLVFETNWSRVPCFPIAWD